MYKGYSSCPQSVPEPGTKEYDLWQAQNVLSGKTEYWELLCKSAYAAVMRSAERADYQKLFQYEDYRDMTDEAFALCYAQLDRYEGRSRFVYWVSGFARNISRNRSTRERTRRKNLGTLQTAAQQHMENWDPMRILIRRQRDNCLWRAFSELDSVDQRILWERIPEDRTYGEIAERTGLRRREVLRRYGKAAVELRRRFVVYNNGSEDWRV